MRASTLIILWVLSLSTAQAIGVQRRNLSLAQAVQAAEWFIVANDYTNLPPSRNTSKLLPESLQWPESRENILEDRHDSLERSAYAYAKHRRGGQPGWTIVFRYKGAAPAYKNGRAVTMDLDGHNARVEHVDAILKAFRKLKK